MLIAGIHFVGWRMAASEMRQTVDDWVTDQRSAGMDVEHGKIEIRGYPFFLRARVTDVMIGDSDVWQWRAEILDIDLTPTALDRLTFRPQGAQSFKAVDVGAWRFNVEDAAIQLANDEVRGWTFEAEVTAGNFTRDTHNQAITVDALTFALAPNADKPDQLDAAIVLKDLLVAVNDEEIDASFFEAAVSLTASHALSVGNADFWQQAGGALELTRVLANLEGAEGEFSGRVTIDGNGYPTGLINASIKNPSGLARALNKAGALPTQRAQIAEAGLAMASFAQGGKIAAPIVLQDGRASIAGVMLGELPQLQ